MNPEDSRKRQEELVRLAKEVAPGKRVLAVVGATWEKVPTLIDEIGGAFLSGAIGLPVPLLPGVKGFHGFLAVADDQFFFVDLSSGKMRVKTKPIGEAKLRYTFHLRPKQCNIRFHTGGNVYRTFTATDFFGPDNINNGLKLIQFSGRAEDLQREKKFCEASWQEIIKKVEEKPLREDDFHEINPEQEAQEKFDRRNSSIVEVSLSCH